MTNQYRLLRRAFEDYGRDPSRENWLKCVKEGVCAVYRGSLAGLAQWAERKVLSHD